MIEANKTKFLVQQKKTDENLLLKVLDASKENEAILKSLTKNT